MIRFGVCAKPEQLQDVIDAGYNYIELNLTKITAMEEAEFAALEETIQRAPIKAEAFNGFCPSSLLIVGENADPEAFAAYAEKALSRAARLGGKIAVLGAGKSRCVPESFSRETACRQLREAFDFCATVASKYGITVALEPLNSRETNLVNTVSDALTICKQVNNPYGKCLADFFHVYQSGESLDAIREAGDLLVHTHIANPQRDMPHSEEDLALCKQWAQALKDCRYSGRLSLEGHYAPDFQKDIADTRKVLEIFNQ